MHLIWFSHSGATYLRVNIAMWIQFGGKRKLKSDWNTENTLAQLFRLPLLFLCVLKEITFFINKRYTNHILITLVIKLSKLINLLQFQLAHYL